MKKPADPLLLFRKPVVERDCCVRFFDSKSNPALLEIVDRVRAGLQPQLLSATQDDDRAFVLEELEQVRGLDSRHVMGSRFAPIPPPAAAGPEFHVLGCAEAFDFHPAPGEVCDDR